MLNSEDIEQIVNANKNVFVTKDEFHGTTRKIDTRLDLIAQKVAEHDVLLADIKENMATKSDLGEITNKLDAIMHEVKTSRQETVIANHRLDKVEKRVTNLEEKVGM